MGVKGVKRGDLWVGFWKRCLFGKVFDVEMPEDRGLGRGQNELLLLYGLSTQFLPSFYDF